MTPVATPVAVRAITWDAALEETLSRAADPAQTRSVLARVRPAASTGSESRHHVHSVHRRAVNLRIADELVALVSPDLDDAPATVRVPVDDWTALQVEPGDDVSIAPDGFRIETKNGPIAVLTGPAAPWTPSDVCLCALSPSQLLHAEEIIARSPAPVAQTAFGRAASALLAQRGEALEAALLERDPAGVADAASRLLGLGEGLTPSGDDVLTGLAFVSAQRGMRLRSALPSLTAALDDDGAERTTLLSAVTIRHALRARAPQSLHALVRAVRDRDDARIEAAAVRVAAIGHTSGTDMLHGVRLALRTEAALRTASAPVPATPMSGIVQKEHV
ncbi:MULTISPECIES: DUF2877 domain-containing protein [unclassified Microbacterium]|uniref:DUF2877 domain-containing protein n=1 Tax=unclassified Microbacterium TaxID=2609290 RepID=UPI003667EB0A